MRPEGGWMSRTVGRSPSAGRSRIRGFACSAAPARWCRWGSAASCASAVLELPAGI